MSNGKPVTLRNRNVRKPVEADPGLVWGPMNSALLALGLVLLVIGFWTLAKGSLTLAPLLLVLGYLGFIPAALLVRPRTRTEGE